MINRSFYYGAVVLALIGLGISYIIKPDSKEMALMNYKSLQSSHALDMYERLWAGGDVSPEVMMALSHLYMQYGQIDKATQVVEQFVTGNPESAAARKRLGVLYRYDQRESDYLENLEKLYHIHPSAKLLRDLTDIYDSDAKYEEQINVLNKLITNYEATEDEYVQLAYLYAAKKFYTKASVVFDSMIANLPDPVKPETLEFAVSLWLDLDQIDKAEQVAKDQLARTKSASSAMQVARVMYDKGAIREALEVLRPFESQAKHNPVLLNEISQLKIANGQLDEVYHELKILYQENTMPDVVFPTFVKLALIQSDYNLVYEIVKERDISLLTEEDLISLAEVTVRDNDPELSLLLQERLGRETLDTMPVLDLILALAVKDPNLVEKEIKVRSLPYLSPFNRIMMLRAYFNAGDVPKAEELLATFNLNEHIPSGLFVDLAIAFIDLHHIDKGTKLFADLKAKHEGKELPNFYSAWALLSTAKGHSKEVIAWLDEGEKKSRMIYQDLFFTAKAYKHNKLAMAIAERMYRLYPGDSTKLYYADALYLNGEFAKALPLLRELILIDDRAQSYYIAAVDAAIKEASPSDAKALREEFKNYLVGQLQNDNLKARQKRELAYILVDHGFKREAENIWRELAEKAGPDHPDTDQLLYLWGPRPEAYAVKWLVQRAETSKGDDRASWFSKLVYSGHSDKVLKIIKEQNVDMSNKKIQDIYLVALARQHQGRDLGRLIASEVGKENDPKRLELLTQLALYQDQAGPARQAFDRLTQISPTNDKNQKERIKTIEIIAGSLLEQGRKSEAEQFLMRHINTVKQDKELVDQLTYIWGPRPKPEALAWMKDRAARARSSDRAKWFDKLLYTGQGRQVVEIIEEKKVPLTDQKTRVSYYDALIQSQQLEKLGAAINAEIATTNDPKRLAELGKLATAESRVIAAGNAYEKLLRIQPNNSEAIKRLAILRYQQGNYQDSTALLERYLRLRPADYETDFYMGASLAGNKHTKPAAGTYYRRALNKMNRLPESTLRTELMRAQILVELKEFPAALRLYRDLLAAHPENPDIRADFGHLLIDLGRHKEAEQVLT